MIRDLIGDALDEAIEVSEEVLFEGIRALIVKHMGVKPEQVTMDTRLGQDLGIDGSDAYEVLVQYKDRFNVDLAWIIHGAP